MVAQNNFKWPESGRAECPDWNPKPECGNGLHGLLWGIGDWSLSHLSDPTAKWLVVEVKMAEVVDLVDKVKFPSGNVVYCGGLPGAQSLIAEKRLLHLASTAGEQAPASTTGYKAPASTTGEHSVACCLKQHAVAKCGPNGSIILSCWDGTRLRHVVAYAGENGIEPGVWYELSQSGQVVKAADQNPLSD
jgi:hypothetical protein